jgi:MbtH protein
MTNPFDDEDGRFLVLTNDENQHSLWPVFAAVPAGWNVAHAEDTRQACLEFIEKSWTDMRPASLIRRMEADAAERAGAQPAGNRA